MSKTTAPAHDIQLVHSRSVPSADEIRHQLQAVLASPIFHGSKRCQQFLEYVCEKSLLSEAGALKERMIAVEVFGRQPQTDLGDDTIVRVGAREVRKRLAQYYVTPEGAAAEVRIDLPPGSYAPEFRYMNAPPPPPETAPAPVVPIVVAQKIRPKRRDAMVACGAIVVVAAGALVAVRLLSPSPNLQAFQQFWKPVFRAPEPLLVAVAHPIVYHPSGRALKMNEAGLPPQDLPLQRALQLPPSALTGSDIVPVFNQYVGYGDMVAATEVASMLARHSKSVRVRLASGVEFADLRRAQALLIGAVTNHWTMELQQNWRFRFSWTPGSVTVITDAQKERQWSIPASDDGSAPEDYILICRIRNSFTGGLTMVAAGLKQFGTEAGGRLLADPEQLGVILRKLPAGWESRNLQLVLHARVIGNAPGQPELQDWHVW
ncbi:conserved hypothetical protein [Candidatus Sulfopaludibacter sp. SbA3]|nr:conserved hypothetical protein [Candidatus Sulfopaludibacter sp. SbA3]